MKIEIDTESNTIKLANSNVIDLYSVEGFKFLSDLWLKVGWDQKYLYTFTWCGRPIIQLPEDILRVQEVIYSIKPDIIIETGVAHGGSLMLYASICKTIGKGKVIGVDIEIRPKNRISIENHELFEFITLLEGNSISGAIIEKVSSFISDTDTVLVILDSCHDYEHVFLELETYSNFVTPGSFIVVTDGSQEFLGDTPRARLQYPKSNTWGFNNPKKAIDDFISNNKHFILHEPNFLFNESAINFRLTHWPSAFLKRIA
jgi:cephalosporin hydroxylase